MNALEKNAAVISAILAKLLVIGINDEMIDAEAFDLDDDLKRSVHPCMNWLANEGLVTWAQPAHSLDGFAWHGPTLTSRGIAIMGAKFEVNGQSVSVAEYVKDPKPADGNYSVIGDFLGSALGGFTKSVMS